MSKETERLLALARTSTMTPSEKEEQRRSFAYGNAGFENEYVTREVVNTAAECIEADRATKD